MELADCGSLETVLTQRTFPRLLQLRRPGTPAEAALFPDLKVTPRRGRGRVHRTYGSHA